MSDIAAIMQLAPVIPVLTVEHVADAQPLAEALVAGGLRALEITLRTPAALDVIRAMKDVEGAVVGAGTILAPKHLDAAFQAGARFIVSPGLTERIAEEAGVAGVPLLPGVATATEVMRGLDLGLTHFKFFPAEQAGGASMLKAFAGPFAAARFCPTGGVSPGNAETYLALPNVLCVGGSWIATPELIAAGAWTEITARARAAAALR
ncbi:MAG: 2-dehydro-3-deoxyphosphogluconate aldolase / 4-hydroxy-2-oxoglutarate aldolase [Alphaproteobacteria bacterium]|nr:MAG: 2-dehydro-3-deoxyphosphogluconate aldolase / 4-hydroxy-2-oxoglutarate aldolase [Caulobacteraceae bacterium]TPW03624.1 MAG: 2-dehydro-3-deoxyphosphogluconate aldolase / 4-hydroxy-2-oxoglutarate aldolase [Alphaproteobacteria bacterium]